MYVVARRSIFIRVICRRSARRRNARHFYRSGLLRLHARSIPLRSAIALRLLWLSAPLISLRPAIVTVGGRRAAFDLRTSALDRRMRCRRSGMYGVRVRTNFRMRNDLRSSNLVHIHMHGFTGHRA